MKIRVYYGEVEEYNYIMFIAGNKFIVFCDMFDFNKISRENMSEIVARFEHFKLSNFLDLYREIKSCWRDNIDRGNIEEWQHNINECPFYWTNTGCGVLKYDELSKRLKLVEKIKEIE